MTDILDLDGWHVVGRRHIGSEYEIEAEYTVPPKACTKCGNIGNLYKHGTKPIYIRDSPIRGRPVRILANAQRFKCRECGCTFIQPLGGVHPDSRMTSRCVEFIQEQCLRQTFLHIAEIVGCDDKTVRNLAATRNWREEILAFFDHPISNGYTEALNGVAKVINRSGRGYSFEVLRARLLYCSKRGIAKQPTLETCWSCGGKFEETLPVADHIKPAGDTPTAENGLRICAACNQRFHTGGASEHQSPSTP